MMLYLGNELYMCVCVCINFLEAESFIGLK
jgi:hypothetical protein